MKIKYFKSANDFRGWLEKNHATAQEATRLKRLQKLIEKIGERETPVLEAES